MSDLLKDLLEKRDKAYESFKTFAESLIEQDTEVTEEQTAQRVQLRSKVDLLDTRIDEVKSEEERSANLVELRSAFEVKDDNDDGTETRSDTDARVLSEPMTYGKNSPHSYYMDLARLSVPACTTHSQAQFRMAKWGHEMAREARLDSDIGKSAVKQVRELTRSENEVEHRSAMKEFEYQGETEFRAPITTGGGATASAAGGSGAAMVAPFVIPDYVPFREAGRQTADAMNRQELPPYGMNLYIPAVTSAASVAQQTEANQASSGLTEVEPGFGYISNSVVTISGQVNVNQQALDRSGPGFQMDEVLSDALRRDLAPKVDIYVIQQILSGAGSITNSGTVIGMSKRITN